MKYFKDNKLYIQASDLRFLLYHGYNIPGELLNKILFLTCNLKNEELGEYVVFESEEDIKYLNSIPFIIDYEETKNLDDDALMEFIFYSKEEIDHIQSLYKRVYRYQDLISLNSEYDKERLRYDALQKVYNERIENKKTIKIKRLEPRIVGVNRVG